jgi:hypothetical protein
MNSTEGSGWLVSEGTGRDCCATALADASKAMMKVRLFIIRIIRAGTVNIQLKQEPLPQKEAKVAKGKPA